MRIQETDRILKESRYARQTTNNNREGSAVARAWKAISNLPNKLVSLFKH